MQVPPHLIIKFWCSSICTVCPGGTRYCGDGEPASALNCVPIDQYCDGVVNCPNGLDESSCQSELVYWLAMDTPLTPPPTGCPLGSLPCPSDQGVLCYNSSLSCNGVPDCPSGTDESADICGVCFIYTSNFVVLFSAEHTTTFFV